MKQRPFTIIHFEPSLECEDCPQLANVAILNPDFSNEFAPCCPLHGLIFYPSLRFEDPSPRDLDEQHMLISRYVLSQFANTGKVILISRIRDLASIAGWRPTTAADLNIPEDRFRRQHTDDIGWQCRYQNSEGERHDVAAVWSWDYFEFELYTL